MRVLSLDVSTFYLRKFGKKMNIKSIKLHIQSQIGDSKNVEE